ncbi:hypothetical protein Lnau_2219 [Legionella nautarum]|uniref:Uncharacterized protein n=2 Tax=Legionella nautarum TaxID=45070 RepID=A0A0W0WN32_9GAMM|nr:hypothetical protein Lnau_2219 [Legionella nautarum]
MKTGKNEHIEHIEGNTDCIITVAKPHTEEQPTLSSDVSEGEVTAYNVDVESKDEIVSEEGQEEDEIRPRNNRTLEDNQSVEVRLSPLTMSRLTYQRCKAGFFGGTIGGLAGAGAAAANAIYSVENESPPNVDAGSVLAVDIGAPILGISSGILAGLCFYEAGRATRKLISTCWQSSSEDQESQYRVIPT